MNIVHVITSLDSDKGGPPRVVTGLVNAQKKLNHNVQIVSSKQSLSSISKADVVHLHGVWEPIIYIASRIALKNNIPYLLTPHGMLDHQYSLNQKAIIKKLLLWTHIKGMLCQASTIHALNKAEKKSISFLHLPTTISIVPNGVNPPTNNQINSLKNLSAIYPNVFTEPYFIFLGRLHHVKGIDILINAFNQFVKSQPKIKHNLVIAGPDNGELINIKRQIKMYRLDSRVHLIGPLNDTLKLTALKHSKAFVLPSRQEGFSIAVLEALSLEVPVIISKQTNFPEVKKSNSGLEVDLNPVHFAQAMNQLASHPNYAKKLGGNGRQLVLKNFTWEKVAKQMISLYKTL